MKSSSWHPPVLDWTPLQDASNKKYERTRLDFQQALFTYGCCYIRLTSDEDITTVSAMQQTMTRFFNAPASEKEKLLASAQDGRLRGYIRMGDESGSTKFLEVKETFSYGSSSTITSINSCLTKPNRWNDSIMDTKVCNSFFKTNVKWAVEMCKAIAAALDLPTDFFDQFCNDSAEAISLMRVFHYLSLDTASTALDPTLERTGSSPHTDWGFLTLIVQDPTAAPALQVWNDGCWHDAPALRNTIL